MMAKVFMLFIAQEETKKNLHFHGRLSFSVMLELNVLFRRTIFYEVVE